MTARRQAHLLLLGNAIIWGAAFPLVKPAFSFISPIQFLYLRYLLASVLILPLLIHLLRKHRPNFKTILKIAALETLGAPVALSLLYLGLANTSVIEAGLIGSMYPFLITLGGIFILKEVEEKKEWWGLGLSLIGTILLVIEPIFNGTHLSFSLKGNMLILLHNFVVAGYYLTAKRFYKNQPKLLVTGLGYWVSLLVFFVFLRFQNIPTTPALLNIPAVLIASGYMGVFGSIIALTLYLKGQDIIEASEATLFSYLTGIFTIPFAFFLSGEVVTPIQLAAVAIIAAGVFLGEYRKA